LTENEIDDCFAHLRWRSAAFGAKYPFTVDSNRHIVSSSEILDMEQQLYVLLLLCANLPAITDLATRQSLTDAFERTSLVALRKFWPSAETKPFGKNETEYVGSKWERINKLGRDIGGRPQLSGASFRGRDSGDGGIDIVSWVALDNYESENIPSGLGQCACSREDWSVKQSEVSGDRLRKLLVPTHPWMQIIFIPICFRNNQGRWAFDGDVASTILLDRLRISLLIDAGNEMGGIQPPDIVTEFLETRLELV
jgi:hypothetical protein